MKKLINNPVYGFLWHEELDMYKKILVPLDGSKLAEAVLPHAQALAKSEGAEIVILRVPELPAADLFTRNPAMAKKIVEDSEIETDKYLKAEARN